MGYISLECFRDNRYRTDRSSLKLVCNPPQTCIVKTEFKDQITGFYGGRDGRSYLFYKFISPGKLYLFKVYARSFRVRYIFVRWLH